LFWQNTPDVAFVGIGVNSTFDYYPGPHTETIARELMEERSIPTVWVTQNDSTTPYDHALIGDQMFTLHDAIGGEVADTEAYVDEQRMLGVNVYIDTIHCNANGQRAWAEACLGVLNPHYQIAKTVRPVETPVINCPTASETASFGYGQYMVSGTPVASSSAVARTTSGLGAGTQYLPQNFGFQAAQGYGGYTVSSGGYIQYTFHSWNTAAVVIERGAGNSFTMQASWVDNSGTATSIGSVLTYTDGATTLPGIYDIVKISDLTAAIAAQAGAQLVTGSSVPYLCGSIRLTVTSGSAIVLGVVFGAPRQQPISLNPNQPGMILFSPLAAYNTAITTNSWFIDTDNVSFYNALLCSDTLNSGFTLNLPQVHGINPKGCQIQFRRQTAGGIISWFTDGYGGTAGTAAGTKDLYLAGRPGWFLSYLPGYQNSSIPGNILSGGSPNRSLTIKYTGNNGSRVAPTNGNHGIDIFNATLFY
jgi:hypothetical protein